MSKFLMLVAKVVSALLFFVMGGAILYALNNANFAIEGNVILSFTWGKVTLIDLYSSLLLIWGWMAYRERWYVALVLGGLMVTLGALAASAYVFYALMTSGGEWRRFWLGRHADA